MSGLAIGIDLGGTELRAALIGPDGALRARRQTATDTKGGPQAVLAQMLALIAGLGTDGVQGIGIAAPGPLDPIAGICIAPPTL